jgi:nicotinate-nucleotide pyrophosphorylase (carboxylating)
MLDAPDPAAYRDVVRRALAEDVGSGDITTRAIVPAGLTAEGTFVAKASLVIAGLPVACVVFAEVDPTIRLELHVADGERASPGQVLGRAQGLAASLLVAERTALNFLQHLSGVATLTRRYVDAARGRLAVLDTRKTIPGFRMLEKYAVRCGGGRNHRSGLYDAVLIKDNHIRIAGGVGEAVRRVRASGQTGPIEVEAQSLADVDAAVDAGADIIMLDNLDDRDTLEGIARIAGRAKVELSGNMTEGRVAALSVLGADYVSVGALTHSAPAADISFELTL